MTGKELMAKLAQSGTGKSKMKVVAQELAEVKNPTAAQVISAFYDAGFNGTVEKACKIAGESGMRITNPIQAARMEVDEKNAEIEKLKAQIAELEKRQPPK